MRSLTIIPRQISSRRDVPHQVLAIACPAGRTRFFYGKLLPRSAFSWPRLESTTMSHGEAGYLLTKYLAPMEISTICEWKVGGGLGSRPCWSCLCSLQKVSFLMTIKPAQNDRQKKAELRACTHGFSRGGGRFLFHPRSFLINTPSFRGVDNVRRHSSRTNPHVLSSLRQLKHFSSTAFAISQW